MHLQSFGIAVLLECPSFAYLQASILSLHFFIFAHAFLITPNPLATFHLCLSHFFPPAYHLTIYIFSCLFVYCLALFTRNKLCNKLCKSRDYVLFLVLNVTGRTACHAAMCTVAPSLRGMLYTDKSQQSPSPGLACS